MFELESESGIMAYIYGGMPVEITHKLGGKPWLYDHLDDHGFFEKRRHAFKDEVLKIFNWFLYDANTEPGLSDIQAEYLTDIHNEIEAVGETLNLSRQDIFETFDWYCSQNNYSIEDEIKDVLVEQGLATMYLKAPQDDYALIENYFGAQMFFPDILNNLMRRRAN